MGRRYPEHEYNIYGKLGNKGLKIKKSVFVGARVYCAIGCVFVKTNPPALIGNLMDRILLQVISGIMNRKIASEIVDYLREEYR